MAEATTRDALIAEMLGDIGRLHDGIDEVKRSLPALADETLVKIAPIVGMVVDASNNLTKATDALRAESRAAIEIVGKTQAKAIESLDQRASELDSRMHAVAREAIRTEVGQEVRELVSELRKATRTDLIEKASYAAIGGATVLVLGELVKAVLTHM